MGGHGSTRWNWEHTRQTTGGLLKLDVRSLKGGGALHPGAVATVSWGEGQWIRIRMDGAGERLTLEYRTRGRREADWTPCTVRVWMECTPCHHGGERVWFRCPGCQSRRAVLYSAGGVFACRACHDLAYASTREDAIERANRRILKLQRRLKAPPGCDLFHVPGKPPRMHGRTYERLAAQLLAEHRRRDALWGASCLAILRRGEALLARLDNSEHLRN